MNAPVSGYYGKLPISPEFLRLHAAGPELRELDEWFQRGVQYAKAKAGSEWSTLLAQADIWNFLFVPEGNVRVVCGAVFASRDRAGRSFPFLTFLLLERNDVLSAPWLIPLRCRTFLRKTRQFLQQLRADLDWNTFCASVDSLPAEVDPDASIEAGFEDYVSHTTTREFWSRLCAAADHPESDGLGHERAIHLHPTGEQSGERATSGRHLPLLKGQTDETYDLPFWLQLHARLFGVKKGVLPALFAFWSRAPSKVEPCVLLSFGRPSPNLTRFIVSPDAQDEAWYEGLPRAANPQESVSECSASSSMQAADDSNISLRQFLDSMR
ncbi:MAG: type VI secretion system-associated protein TagF [Nitrospiraceae bacterium]|nr:MAG: type VI secretion system-associated protein TagF [Nitrospiraceae bacterium]